MVPPVSSSSRMSETKMDPTLCELARCVAALYERRGASDPFSRFSARHPSRYFTRENQYSLSLFCSETKQRNACDRASSRTRTGYYSGRRFSITSAHCPQRPGAVTHARKTHVSCSVSALRRVAGELASNRARSVRCDGVACSSLLTATERVDSREKYTDTRLLPLEWGP